ncbi:Uncharacterised protein [Legionella lansingensis]|uniref:Glycosyltransferase RgtA/B/C/D-like domain-containing protein n=1 Tax=Legionella lansingensis TaxID=45067 RepID=A0A0W0VQ26_9GAMM|nr:hypothetical protein [Legionella lansingensis]KTD22276.1 hypothetical protein Llan_1217 [Legionella lansingensis]SNV50619.1 Uncharacterised protein [Legionella lansingensis]
MTLLPMRYIYFAIPSLLLIALIAIEWYEILTINSGTFSYSLDDPYIHLSLAQHIGAGEYSLNHGEFASPSSSILWPFLLAPFSYFKLFEFTPLLLNSVFALFTLWVFIHLVLSVLPEPQLHWAHIIIFCLLIPTLNLVGLAFTGLEHSLQMLLSVLLIYGLIIESRRKLFPYWLAVVIIVGPLIRYENLALSIPALVFLFYRGHKKQALYSLGILIVLLAVFSLFLIHIGQPPLASAIVMKLGIGVISSLGEGLIAYFRTNLIERQTLIFLIFLIFFIGLIFFSRLSPVKKQLLVVLSTSLLLHLFLGKFNWYHRYELYLYAAVWFMILYLYFDSMVADPRQIIWYPVVFLGLVFASFPYLSVLYTLPRAANNIFLQQYQMRKFIVTWAKAPVVVNDIGWVSFNNPYYVLDLWGLSNYAIYKERISDKSSLWMAREVKKSGAKLAMVYKNWFPLLPKNWVLLGCLSFNAPRITPANRVVHFYATDIKYAAELKQQLTQFIKELPEGAQFSFNCNNGRMSHGLI